MSVEFDVIVMIFCFGCATLCMGVATALYHVVIAEVNAKLPSEEQFSQFFHHYGKYMAIFKKHREFYPRDKKIFWMHVFGVLSMISTLVGGGIWVVLGAFG